jgi:hypothetical protein
MAGLKLTGSGSNPLKNTKEFRPSCTGQKLADESDFLSRLASTEAQKAFSDGSREGLDGPPAGTKKLLKQP